MTNGNDVSRHYQDAMTAQLGERVTNLGRRQTNLESEMRSGFNQIDVDDFAVIRDEKLCCGATGPRWQALGVALTFCTILGGLAYLPIQKATTDLKAWFLVITQKMITQEAMVWRTARSAEHRLRRDNAVKDLREAQQVED